MEILNVECRLNETYLLDEEFLKSLPKKLILFTTIQYMNSIEGIVKQLKEENIDVNLNKMRHTLYPGQILGCSNTRIEEEGDVLYVGDGLFHPKAILLKNNKKVYTYNPKTKESNILTREDVKPILKRIRGSYIKFLSSKNVGVLITTKSGQCKPQLKNNLKEKFPDKNFFFFLDNTYDFNSLKDFNFVDVYLNTMCERIGYDDSDVRDISILNVEDLYEIMNDEFQI